MNDEQRKAYLDFMWNPNNSHNCKECPANEGQSSYQDRLPCGQWNCWVDCHTRQAMEAMRNER